MKTYYPTATTGCNPLHEVKNWSYVRQIIRAARRCDKINPILIEGSVGSGNLLAGTHRAAANAIMMMLGETNNMIEIVSIDDIEASEELLSAVANSDYETIDYLWDRK